MSNLHTVMQSLFRHSFEEAIEYAKNYEDAALEYSERGSLLTTMAFYIQARDTWLNYAIGISSR